MRITVREDVALPAAQVFAAVTDTDAFEREALRRGAEVRRLDRLPALGPGAAWETRFAVRGRTRELRVEVARLEAPVAFAGRFVAGGLSGTTSAEVIALSRSATRLTLTLDVRGGTLGARLLLQSLRLGRAGLEARARARGGLGAARGGARRAILGGRWPLALPAAAGR